MLVAGFRLTHTWMGVGVFTGVLFGRHVQGNERESRSRKGKGEERKEVRKARK